MDLFDVAILVPIGLLAVFFATVAVMEWQDTRVARDEKRGDAQVIQHARSDRSVNPAA